MTWESILKLQTVYVHTRWKFQYYLLSDLENKFIPIERCDLLLLGWVVTVLDWSMAVYSISPSSESDPLSSIVFSLLYFPLSFFEEADLFFGLLCLRISRLSTIQNMNTCTREGKRVCVCGCICLFVCGSMWTMLQWRRHVHVNDVNMATVVLYYNGHNFIYLTSATTSATNMEQRICQN